MAAYIALVNFTDQGIRQIRQTTERAKALVNAAANLGIKIKDIYWTMGGIDGLRRQHRLARQHSHANPAGFFCR
jgi:uncharacterized protein with GYD domain